MFIHGWASAIIVPTPTSDVRHKASFFYLLIIPSREGPSAMQRTKRSVSLSSSSSSPVLRPAFQIDAATCSSGVLDFQHTLFAPLHYEPGYAYPLIVWLHGQGNDERQLQRIMPLISMRNYVAVAPRGLVVPSPEKPEKEVYGWLQADEYIAQSEQRIFDAIEMATQKLHIAPRRIFLAGFGCGGTMAFRAAMNHPEHFAGVISLCGAFPSGRTPFSNLAAVRRLGVFLITGRSSEAYSAEEVCENLRLFHTAGLSLTLRQYPCGHELTPQMLSDIDRWIIEQITASTQPAVEA
jgi:phospholipase/carboxylesterase